MEETISEDRLHKLVFMLKQQNKIAMKQPNFITGHGILISYNQDIFPPPFLFEQDLIPMFTKVGVVDSIPIYVSSEEDPQRLIRPTINKVIPTCQIDQIKEAGKTYLDLAKKQFGLI